MRLDLPLDLPPGGRRISLSRVEDRADIEVTLRSSFLPGRDSDGVDPVGLADVRGRPLSWTQYKQVTAVFAKVLHSWGIAAACSAASPWVKAVAPVGVELCRIGVRTDRTSVVGRRSDAGRSSESSTRWRPAEM
jgi:hypothetical protein